MPVRYDPYFEQWLSVLVLKSKDNPIGAPRYQHRVCGGMVPVPKDRVPPRVCPHCNSDTAKENAVFEEFKDAGVVLERDNPNRPLKLGQEVLRLPPPPDLDSM